MTIRWWEWLTLILTLILIIGLLWAYYGAPRIKAKCDISFEDFLEQANNGDLIFLAGDSRGERACRWASGSAFSHSGLLFRENSPSGESILYVWEADIGQGSRTGPRVMVLKNKLERYKGFKILGWKRLEGPRPSTKKILEIVERHSTKSLDSQMWPWIFENLGLSPLNRWVKDKQKVFCSELLGITLQDLKIMHPKVIPYSLSPRNFHENKVDLLPSYRYLDTSYVNFVH